MKRASIANEAGFNRKRSLLRWPSKSVAFLRRKNKKNRPNLHKRMFGRFSVYNLMVVILMTMLF